MVSPLQEGVQYYFVSKEDFMKDLKAGLITAWKQQHGEFYGTSVKKMMEIQVCAWGQGDLSGKGVC